MKSLFQLHFRRWSSGMPTLFFYIGRYALIIGGFASNTIPGIHIQLDTKRLIVVTLRTGGRRKSGNAYVSTSFVETNWYIRLGQIDHQWLTTKPIWAINWQSEHFVYFCARHALSPFIHYSEDEPYETGYYMAHAKIGFIHSHAMM